MSDIYEQHNAAFANVSAFVILKDGDRVATVAIKFPKDGAGRLYAYFHILSFPMVRGHANGYGYDKRSAAVSDAARKIEIPTDDGSLPLTPTWHHAHSIKTALASCGGVDWTRAAEKAGFQVIQAV